MASFVSIKNALSAGELSPSLWGRTDLEKWHSGTSTCRNFFVNYRGGVSSRAGLAYVGMCLQLGTGDPPRDIPFQFSLNQGYVLEFGLFYLRFKQDGGYVLEDPEAITNISQANQAVITIPAHNYSVDDWIFISGVQGMTNFNNLSWIVSNIIDADNIQVTDLFGNPVDSTMFNAYTSGGFASRLYTLVSPYHAHDLPYLKYTQSADTMTLTCVNTDTGTEYPPYALVRHGQADWTLTQESFASAIAPPTNLTVTAQSSDSPSTYYSYVVTAIDSKTGEESIASNIASIQNNDISISAGSNALTWDQVDGASSYNVYAATPSYSLTVPISSVFGFIGVALGPSFTDTNIVPDFSVVPPSHSNPFAISPVTDVKILTGGSNYSQGTISWSVTSATGTGFDGFPVVANGEVVGFIITNPGTGYTTGDTITFSDTGGGVAAGNFTYASNPTDGEHIDINAIEIKFRRTDQAPGFNEVSRGTTAELAAQSLCNFLNASANVNLVPAIYSFDSSHVYVTYKTPGIEGNDFRIDGGTTPWTASGPTLTGGGAIGSGATATLVIGEKTGIYPGVCGYFQQRRVYAASLNEPDTYWMSQPGLFNNMDSSIPVTDGDAITGTPWAQQVNGINFMVPMPGGNVVLTGRGAWQLNGGGSGAITPSNQVATPQAYNGCHNTVPPLTINYDILYVQSKGSIIRDLAYNFYTNIYTGTDLTLLSNQLFNGFQTVSWCWAEEPYKLAWLVRDDGTLLSLTYLKEQEVYAWSRHDTAGQFVSVCSITEPPVDAVYTIVQRLVQGKYYYFSERMDNRLWSDVEQSFCVDSGVQSTLTYPDTRLKPQKSSGSNVRFVAGDPYFTADMVGDIIRVDGGIGQIISYTDPQNIHVNITQNLTSLTPNDPTKFPVLAEPGEWSISTPFTTFSGLNHLEGLEVTILADGSVVPNQTVVNGAVTLPYPATLVTVGLPYTCQVQTLYVDGGDPSHTVQNKRKTISAVGLRVESSRGLQVGADQVDASTQPNFAEPDWVNMNEIKERTNFVNAGSAVPLYTGDWFKNITSGWDVTGQVAVQQVYPLPANILAVIMYWTLGDDK